MIVHHAHVLTTLQLQKNGLRCETRRNSLHQFKHKDADEIARSRRYLRSWIYAIIEEQRGAALRTLYKKKGRLPETSTTLPQHRDCLMKVRIADADASEEAQAEGRRRSAMCPGYTYSSAHLLLLHLHQSVDWRRMSTGEQAGEQAMKKRAASRKISLSLSSNTISKSEPLIKQLLL